MSQNDSEAYQSGHEHGTNSANFADAYENVIRHSEAPIPTEYRGHDKTDRDRWDYERGFADGWDAYMADDANFD